MRFHFPFSDISFSPSELIGADDLKGKFQSTIREITAWWIASDGPLSITTSGSTGHPKTMTFTREQVRASVTRTASALNLRPGMQSLLCIDPAFVGGRMMVLRALILDMDLFCVEPTSEPLRGFSSKRIDFLSMVPLQMERTLANAVQLKTLNDSGCAIIGGAALNQSIIQKLKGLTSQVYQTFGMTETLSHIALRNLSTGEDFYRLLPHIRISQDERDCLVAEIEGFQNPIVTNDIVKIISRNTFHWIGRADYVINSGGIKFHPEVIEHKLSRISGQLEHVNGLFVIGCPDEQLGEHITIVLECGSSDSLKKTEFHKILSTVLDRYEMPREIRMIDRFEITTGGKIDRKASLAKSLLLEI